MTRPFDPIEVALTVTRILENLDVPHTRILHIHPPEDILLQKLRWFKDGREVSDRQWRDILGIVRTQGNRLDRTYLEGNAPVLGVEHLLARALAEGMSI